ncbi:MAG TPA: chloride channel protein [Thermoplasmata archaeon]|nr:chloride channel protein [Thermoplasmata archaeon]
MVLPLPPRFRDLGDFTTADRRIGLLAGLAVLVGVASALTAAFLLGLIGFFTNLFYFGRLSWVFVSPAGNQLGALAILIPILGGVIVGVIARFGSERIRGHGIPEAIESILVHKSTIQPRLAVLKPVSAAISIGSGGPFGAEGPIIMTGGSLGSVFGQTLHLSAAERKVLLVAGAAGGMAATFNTPFAAVLLAVELLLFEWKPRSLIPVGVASAVATLVRWPILGDQPLFPLPSSPLPNLPIAAGALVVGAAVGATATLLTWAVYASEDAFRRLPVHWMWWPAVGGLVVGVGGILDPRALGVGYTTIGLVLAGGLGLGALVLLLVVKGTIWSVSLGSGTSGGVLAPLLMMGASVGAILGPFLPSGSVSLWALVAMGGILGGTMRAPFTGVVFALELTHDFDVVFPLLIAALVAETFTLFTLPRSILTEKVARRGVHVSREYSIDPLETTPVALVMHTDIVTVSPATKIDEAVRRTREGSGRYVGYAVVDERRELVGFVTKEEILAFLGEGGGATRRLGELARAIPVRLFPDHPCRVAARYLAELDLEALPVVDENDPATVVGLFSRESLFRARLLAMEDELARDRVLRITTLKIRLSERLLGRRDRPEPPPPPEDDGSLEMQER